MTFAITGRFVRRVCPVQYEHGEAEVSFSTTVEVDDVAMAAAKANEMLSAAKDLVLLKLGRKPGTDTAQATATEVPAAAAEGEKRKPGRPKNPPTPAPAAPTAPAPAPAAATNEFGEAATETKPAADEFGETTQPEVDEFAEAAEAVVEQPKPMEAKELQALISGHIQAKRISADKVREVMKAFKVARTDDTTPEMRPLIVAEIEKIIKGKK